LRPLFVGRLPLYVSFLLIVLASSVVVGFLTYQVQGDKAAMQQRESQLLRIQQRLVELQGTINDFNRRGDRNAIHRTIARLNIDPTLRAVVVVDDKDKVQYSSVIDFRHRALVDITDLDLVGETRPMNTAFGGVYFDAQNNWVVGSFPIDALYGQAAGGAGGKARLLGIFDINAPLKRVRFEQEQNIIQQVVTFIVLLALAFLMLYRNIRSRINRIIKATQTFIAGDHATRIELGGNDEFAAIARTFDRMAGQIQTQHGRLHQLAHFDGLTQLPNRTQFVDQLEQLTDADGVGNFSVLFIDLDRFKVVNDSLGHQVGDDMLQIIAQRIRGCIKENDTVARFGGDEFLILLHDADDYATVVAILERLLRHIAESMLLAGRPVSTTASIGVARFPRDGQSAAVLIQRADIAMYQAKSHGKNNYHFYRPEIDELSPDRLSLEHHLRQSILHGAVMPYFQPVYDARHNRLVGMEALAHMPDGDGGILPPDVLIPVIEEAGLMSSFGQVMMLHAVTEYQQWVRQHAPEPVPYLALNLSCSQLDEEDFLDQVDRLLAETGVDPQRLEFEITESSLLNHVDQKSELLSAIRARGIRIAVDDFGTGYSSLSYLKKLPLDTLKIDRSFVRDINVDQDDNAIIETIIAMAGKLSLGVVAEGVENYEQLAFLLANHCDVIQGYYFARPGPISELSQQWDDYVSLPRG
jgi:diguanylate cyclase (GGDEF)-like protein